MCQGTPTYSCPIAFGDFHVAGTLQPVFIGESPANRIREVQPWLAEVIDRCGDTLEQAVIVSHHPVTIDYMAGAKGRWFYRDSDGPVRVRKKPERTGEGLSLAETVARGWDR